MSRLPLLFMHGHRYCERYPDYPQPLLRLAISIGPMAMKTSRRISKRNLVKWHHHM